LITAIIGPMGCGKTITAVWLAYQHHKRGWEVYSNVKLPFSEDIFTVFDLEEIRKALVLLDDAIAWLDSRMSFRNTAITWILLQARKRELEIVYTSQVETGVDLRLRMNTNLIIRPTLLRFPIFRLRFYDPEGYELYHKTIRFGKKIINLYDTLEIVFQKICLDDLYDTFYQAGEKVTHFAPLASAKWGLPSQACRSLAVFLRRGEKEDIASIELILRRHGYQLVK